MKKESILILGAGIMQKNAILGAKNLGFNTVVIDSNPNAPYVSLADEFFPIDLKDREGILCLASRLKAEKGLKGIFTAGTDFSASVSYAGEKLGFDVHSFNSTLNASIKPRMRACFDSFGVPSPKYSSFSLQSFDELSKKRFVEQVLAFSKQIGFPCVVKPADNMGARGCRMIRCESEVENAVIVAAKNSRSNTIIIEEYMDGPEFSIDALIYEGTMTITGFADRHIFYKPYFIETGHTMPSSADQQMKLELIAAFALGVKSLGLTCGAAKADIKYTKKGPQIGEIAARLSGGFMSGWTFPYSSDFNLIEQGILISCGKEPQELLKKRKVIDYLPPENLRSMKKPFELYEIPSIRYSAERAWISIPGIVQSVEGFDECAQVPFVQNVFPQPLKPGAEIDFPRNNVEKCGNVVSSAGSFEEASLCAQKACSNIFIRLQANNRKTMDFLDCVEEEDEKGFPPSAFDAVNYLDMLNLDGFIPKDESILKDVPAGLLELLEKDQKDWNYLTAMETALKFDKEFPSHPELPKKMFWKALFRGGFQAAVYVCDSISDNHR